ncbi:ribonucleotide reductase inhibitor-domain-containing protein [Hypoxylon crocopeplum]|nr:ribonucleotide reductase inhibitor-domain-containing protein [Hypoxylon crocopeplum]
MSAPRTKRQFAGAASDPSQRQITSFFSSASPSSINESPRLLSASGYISPALPASVQANLLSVGMRVRKSVPEGYKTGNYSAFSLWNDSGSNSRIATTPSSPVTMGERRSRANAISTPRELLPFCGIHKVGGLGTQPESAPILPYTYTSTPTSTTRQPLLSVNGQPLDDDMDDDDDDVPGLTSSQETIESTTDSTFSPSTAKTRKRSYTEDEDERPETPDRLSLNVNVNVWRDTYDGEVSPRSFAPAGWRPEPASNKSNNNGRVMAIPRKTKLRGSSKLAAAQALDQENVMVVDDVVTDFEEADFLVQTAELGYSGRTWEVEMSDA